MRLETLSVFPEVFSPYLHASIMGRAQKANIFEFYAHDLRDWTHDRHRTVDDAPFGGGQGMLMKPAPIFEAVREISGQADAKPHVVFFSPVGRPYSQAIAQELAQKERILFVCGRYEGMDERVYELADDVISLGDYVLTGGELPALTVIDSVVRLLPGALGDEMSSQDESFSDDGLLEYAQYTRPANFEGREVPSVLLSGDHGAVAVWRRQSALARTRAWRPDLLESAQLTEKDRAYLAELDQQSGDNNE
ncbi:MAG: tRNA (guanosine(37)-N1)-methyltransferase TrmD [Atopobium sp.]|nr:tRNA (guanosine(37)-N1)-methyltransferase TrmD [Atopobium sp.]